MVESCPKESCKSEVVVGFGGGRWSCLKCYHDFVVAPHIVHAIPKEKKAEPEKKPAAEKRYASQRGGFIFD